MTTAATSPRCIPLGRKSGTMIEKKIRIVIPGQTEFMGSTRENVLFVSVIYWIFAYQMSKASQRLERRTGLGER